MTFDDGEAVEAENGDKLKITAVVGRNLTSLNFAKPVCRVESLSQVSPHETRRAVRPKAGGKTKDAYSHRGMLATNFVLGKVSRAKLAVLGGTSKSPRRRNSRNEGLQAVVRAVSRIGA